VLAKELILVQNQTRESPHMSEGSGAHTGSETHKQKVITVVSRSGSGRICAKMLSVMNTSCAEIRNSLGNRANT